MTALDDAANDSRCILLVEDHADTAAVMSRLLGKLGYLIKVADSLSKARAMAREQPCDLLICDLRLPDGSGLELMRELRQQRLIPGIALSGMASDEDRRQSSEAGFEMHLTKPIDFQVLKAAVEEVLH